MDMLDVIHESRQNAIAQREAALDHMGTMALEALLNGENPREIAKKCGFRVGSNPSHLEPGAYVVTNMGMMESLLHYGEPPKHSDEQKFAYWLGKHVTDLILEKMGEITND